MNVCISLTKKYIEGRDTLFRKVKASKYSTYIISHTVAVKKIQMWSPIKHKNRLILRKDNIVITVIFVKVTNIIRHVNNLLVNLPEGRLSFPSD